VNVHTAKSSGAIRRLYTDHRALISIVVGYCILGAAVQDELPGQAILSFQLYNRTFAHILTACVVVFSVGYAVHILLSLSLGESLTKAIAQDFLRNYLTVERTGGFLIAVLNLRIFGSIFMNLKAAIPHLQLFTGTKR